MLKKGKFCWGNEQETCFNSFKDKLISTNVPSLPNFGFPFEVVVDTSGIGIDVVLSQNNHPIEYQEKKKRVFVLQF